MKQDRRRCGTSLLLVALGAVFLWAPSAKAEQEFVIPPLVFRSPHQVKFFPLRGFIFDQLVGRIVCAGSARTGERTLRVSVDAALRAGIFKASGSFDPMGWSVGARRSFPRP